MFERHTTVNMFNMTVKFFDTLYNRWRDKLIRMSSDGKNTMIDHHFGFVTRMVRSASNKVLHLWCTPHHINIIIRVLTESILDGSWIKFAYNWSVFLRPQNNLIIAMNVKCLKKTNQWVHLGRLFKFFQQHQCQLITYTIEKRLVVARSSIW
jgi:hypothetical protein